MKRKLAIAVPAAMTAAMLAACGDVSESSAGTTGDTAGGSAPASCREEGVVTSKDWNHGPKQLPDPENADALKGKKIAFIGFGQDNVWSQWVIKGLECEAETWGATAEFIGPPSFDAQAQYQLASDLAVSKNYDALVIVPNDSTSIAPALKQVVEADIPVVSMLQPAGPDVLSMTNQIPGLTGNVIEDLNVNAEAMAEGVIDACADQDPCKTIVIWGARALAFDKVKPKIFQASLEGHDNIEIVCEADGGYDQDLGRTASADCLQANPDVNVLASQADQMTRGAERALDAAGLTYGLGDDEVKIVSAYGTMHGISQVRAGKWFQTSYNRAQSMSAASGRLVLLALAGEAVDDDLSFLVQDTDFDEVPNRLTREVLDQHPDVTGQWDG